MRTGGRFKTAHLNDVKSSLWRAAQSIAQVHHLKSLLWSTDADCLAAKESTAVRTWQGQDVICFKAQNCARTNSSALGTSEGVCTRSIAS